MNDHEGDALATRSVRLTAHRDRYTELVNAVDAFGRETGIAQQPGWHEFLTAVSEIGANILTYAYAGSEPGDVELALFHYPDRVSAHFRDWGEPFIEQPKRTHDESDDLLDPISLLEESGRGLEIARLALNTMQYQRLPDRTNHWILVKTLAPE